MKPFVAIDGVLDNLFLKVFRCTSVENCAQTENLYCLFEAVPGPGSLLLFTFFHASALKNGTPYDSPSTLP